MSMAMIAAIGYALSYSAIVGTLFVIGVMLDYHLSGWVLVATLGFSLISLGAANLANNNLQRTTGNRLWH